MNTEFDEYKKKNFDPTIIKGVEYGDRWSKGIPHHPKSEKLFKRIAELDFFTNDDYFCWDHGGDGDNGETLMFLFDIYFEEDDKNPNCVYCDKPFSKTDFIKPPYFNEKTNTYVCGCKGWD
ncbi:hypothetical protein KAR91_00485 [Candidatus Pacearchaeota archaeon]|nr:hypothetical protein [Candidatus Pacearchaeota archaeon]